MRRLQVLRYQLTSSYDWFTHASVNCAFPQDYVPSDHDDPPSPQRPSAAHRARAAAAAALSPATQAAVTMASLLGGRSDGGLPPVLPAVVGRPRVKSGAGDDDPNDPDATIEGLTARPAHRRSTPGGRGAHQGTACFWCHALCCWVAGLVACGLGVRDLGLAHAAAQSGACHPSASMGAD